MAIQNKIDFVAFISATHCNPNGDPLNGNRPRTNYSGYGEISDVCIKRKIRNRMLDLGQAIFVRSNGNIVDGYNSLSERAKGELKDLKGDAYVAEACRKWIDVRSFGQVFAFKSENKGNKKKSEEESGGSVSVHVRGPVSIRTAVSCSQVAVATMKITKSVNSEPGEKKSSDTMGDKHYVPYALYKLMGSVNVQLAEKTGFSDDDAKILKECIRTLFVNDASSARPDGSMEVCEFYWFEHNCKDGQYPSAQVHRSVTAKLREGVSMPQSAEDYEIVLTPLDGLSAERVL